jgi:WD40 repeat protein
MAFRPDGKQLAFSDEQHPEIRILDVATGGLLQPLPHPQKNTALAWSSDNRFLAAASDNKNIYVWDLQDPAAQPTWTLSDVGSRIVSVMFAGDATTLLAGRDDGEIVVWTLEQPQPKKTKTLAGHQEGVLTMTASPDGKRLAYLSDANEGTQLFIAKPGDGRGHAITDVDEAIGDFDWAPDGTNLVFEKIDPKILSQDVTIAADALLVLMQYQNKGYALMSF